MKYIQGRLKTSDSLAMNGYETAEMMDVAMDSVARPPECCWKDDVAQTL